MKVMMMMVLIGILIGEVKTQSREDCMKLCKDTGKTDQACVTYCVCVEHCGEVCAGNLDKYCISNCVLVKCPSSLPTNIHHFK